MITPAYAPTATERVLPRLALDFTTASLDPRVTVARALNTATRFNSSGLIEIVNANLPRFDYDPITKICKGLLIEEARSNLLVNSDQFNLTWAQNNTTVTPNDAISPDGTTNADKIDEGTLLSVHSISQAFSSVSGTSYAWSCFVKNIDRRYVQLFYGGAGHGTNAFANFDLQTGTVGTVGSSATASITDVGNGWYRCSIVAAATATSASASAQLALVTSATAVRAENYTGTNKTIYAYGGQCETGAFATSYIPTTTTSLTRNADQVTMTGTNFTSWYNQAAGTFFMQYLEDQNPIIAGGRMLSDTAQLRLPLYQASTTQLGAYDPSTGGFGYNSGALVAGGLNKATTAWDATKLYGCTNGGAVVSTNFDGNFDLSGLRIGSAHDNTTWKNFHAQKLFFYPQRLINAEFQALTK